MYPFSRNDFRARRLLHAFVSISLAITLLSSATFAWQQSAGSAAVATKAAPTLTPTEKKAAARVKLETIREVTTTLSSPAFEGRGTGQPGADRAAQYLADRLQNLDSNPEGTTARTCKRSNSSRPRSWPNHRSRSAMRH